MLNFNVKFIYKAVCIEIFGYMVTRREILDLRWLHAGYKFKIQVTFQKPKEIPHENNQSNPRNNTLEGFRISQTKD